MKIKTLLLATTAVFAFAPMANAGFYIGVDGGIALPMKDKVKDDGVKTNFKLKDGFVGDIVGGYAFDNNFRIELDIGYRNLKLKEFGGADDNGSFKSFAFTANVLYDFKNSTAFTPFVGAGVGVAHAKLKDTTLDLSGSSTKFAALGTVGVSYNFTPEFSASLAYRFFTTLDQKFEDGKYNLRSNEFLLGLRYDFNPVCKSKVASAAATPAKATTSTTVTGGIITTPSDVLEQYQIVNGAPEFTIYFNTNSTRLSPKDKAILGKVLKEYKKLGEAPVTLRIVGAADAVGDKAYNLELSKRRAAIARDALVEMGVANDDILIHGEGAVGWVENSYNRRVVINFVEKKPE